MRKSRTPALSMASRTWSSFGVWENSTRICVPPLKSMPSGMWCQNRMLSSPTTEKISENPRKYHFFPSQSILVSRNSSTVLNPQSRPRGPALLEKKLDRHRRAAWLQAKLIVEDHARHEDGSKQVGKET